MNKINVNIEISVEVPKGANITDTKALVKEWLRRTINWMDDEIEVDGKVIGKKEQV